MIPLLLEQKVVAYSHVTLTTDVRLCQTLFQLTRYSEIDQFDLSLFVDQYIGRLDIWSSQQWPTVKKYI